VCPFIEVVGQIRVSESTFAKPPVISQSNVRLERSRWIALTHVNGKINSFIIVEIVQREVNTQFLTDLIC